MGKERIEKAMYKWFEIYPLTEEHVKSALKEVTEITFKRMEEDELGKLIPVFNEERCEWQYKIEINTTISEWRQKIALLHEIAHIIYGATFGIIVNGFDDYRRGCYGDCNEYERLLDVETNRFDCQHERFVNEIYEKITT